MLVMTIPGAKSELCRKRSPSNRHFLVAKWVMGNYLNMQASHATIRLNG